MAHSTVINFYLLFTLLIIRLETETLCCGINYFACNKSTHVCFGPPFVRSLHVNIPELRQPFSKFIYLAGLQCALIDMQTRHIHQTEGKGKNQELFERAPTELFVVIFGHVKMFISSLYLSIGFYK